MKTSVAKLACQMLDRLFFTGTEPNLLLDEESNVYLVWPNNQFTQKDLMDIYIYTPTPPRLRPAFPCKIYKNAALPFSLCHIWAWLTLFVWKETAQCLPYISLRGPVRSTARFAGAQVGNASVPSGYPIGPDSATLTRLTERTFH